MDRWLRSSGGASLTHIFWKSKISAGFFGNFDKACVTILENNKPVCYLLPDNLKSWVINLVGLKSIGQELLPSFVLFTFNKGKYFADIL